MIAVQAKIRKKLNKGKAISDGFVQQSKFNSSQWQLFLASFHGEKSVRLFDSPYEYFREQLNVMLWSKNCFRPCWS